jgi:hypothetical protein
MQHFIVGITHFCSNQLHSQFGEYGREEAVEKETSDG